MAPSSELQGSQIWQGPRRQCCSHHFLIPTCPQTTLAHRLQKEGQRTSWCSQNSQHPDTERIILLLLRQHCMNLRICLFSVHLSPFYHPAVFYSKWEELEADKPVEGPPPITCWSAMQWPVCTPVPGPHTQLWLRPEFS